ncbi:helix-turn-helix transcriptional regulator [Pedococcus sp. 2YAF34]|uniref:helix-turn-helix transcriptional regulator n=1 Tax=Pedococcus sp. 2YAF34 TaxID=3233032 RepID=UPI003F95C032
MEATNPTARALLSLELLQESPGTTAERLGERLGVSSRAARRYVGILREAGIPVESVRGPYGGYRVGRGLRLPPLTFSASEALGLVMAVLDGHHDAGDTTDPVGSALAKIIRALPEDVAAQAEAVRRATSPAPDRAAVRPDPATAAALVRASSEHHRVRLSYASESGREWTVQVDPWAVVVRHGRWYLLCLARPAEQDAGVRTYRVDRIRELEVLADPFTPPTGIDPVALLEEHLASGWEHSTEVVVDAPADEVAHHLAGGLGRLEQVDATTSRLVGSTSDPWWYAQQLVRLRAPYRVVGGPELQAAARELGARLWSAGATEDEVDRAMP